MTAVFGGRTLPLTGLQFRAALWRGDDEGARHWCRMTRELPTPVGARTAGLFAIGLGEGDPAAAEQMVHGIPTSNLRFRTLILQIATEVFAATCDTDRALTMLEHAAESALVDVVWLRLCPLFAGLHDEPRFQEVLRSVDRRARQLWRR